MFSQRFRRCPKCVNGYLDNYELNKIKWDRPAICNLCNQGFIRFGASGLGFFGSFVLELLITIGMSLGMIVVLIKYGVYVTVFYVLTVIVFAFLWDKIMDRYGLLIEHPNMPLSNEKQIDPQTVALIEATAESDINLIQQLLGEGANPEDKDVNGFSAMDHARGRGYKNILEIYKRHLGIS